jgi:hypothetical protein
MIPTLTASVGAGGANRPADVLTIQKLLNLLPPALGGTLPRLVTDSLVGPLTTGAIRAFQQLHFGWNDGRVDPQQKTITRLGEVVGVLTQGAAGVMPIAASRFAAATGTAAATAQEKLMSLWILRLLIVNIALNEAFPAPGAVSDQKTAIDTDTQFPLPGPGPHTVRAGWRRLKDYFDEASPGFLKMAIPTHRNGIKVPTQRVRNSSDPATNPSNGRPFGVHWCGLFATWVYRKALERMPPLPFAARADVRWMWPCLSIPRRFTFTKPFVKASDIQPGDVCIIENGFSHHFVAIDYADPIDNKIWSVNGNSTAEDGDLFSQSVLVKKQSLGKLSAVYSADGAMVWLA